MFGWSGDYKEETAEVELGKVIRMRIEMGRSCLVGDVNRNLIMWMCIIDIN